MHGKHLIDKILITLEVGDKTALFILLTRDGIIHRKGDGNPVHNDVPLMMGISREGHFDALLMTIQEDIFDYSGVMKLPNPIGTEFRLTMIFQGKNDVDYSFRVVYGSESDGPPYELAEILINAVKLTDGWYKEQLANIPATVEKKWWRVWK